MRLRRKRNLDQLLCSVQDVVIGQEITEKNSSLPIRHFLNIEDIFARQAPLWLDVGCGKGVFSVEIAKKYPEINVIAVERISNVLVEGALSVVRDKIPNLRFLCAGAEYLPRFFHRESIEKIFLNFSTPFPKPSNENRRLTHQKFCKIYLDLLKPCGVIELKTDDGDFFHYSAQTLETQGFVIAQYDEDFCSQENIETEHEKMYRQNGKKICKLIAEKR